MLSRGRNALASTLALLTVGVLALTTVSPPTAHAAPVGVPPSPELDGTVVAWGANAKGQTAVPPASGEPYVAVSGGAEHSLVLTSDGQVEAFGCDEQGESTVPVLPPGSTYTAVAAGSHFSLALTGEGRIVHFGDAYFGQAVVPSLPGGTRYTAVAAGAYHALALTSDGQVKAWGSNASGQTDVPALGNGETYTAIAAGTYHSLALTSEGRVRVFGRFTQTHVPALGAGQTYTAVAAGGNLSAFLTSDGQVRTAGFLEGGYPLPVPAPPSGSTYTAVALAADRVLALTNRGEIVTAGNSGNGLGMVPDLPTGHTYVAVAAGGEHSLALHAPLRTQTGPAPTITGDVAVGSTLTATLDRRGAAVTHQWNVNGVPILGATSPTLTLGEEHRNQAVTVTTSVTRTGYAPWTLTSVPTAPVAARLQTGTRPTITGDAVVGATLTATHHAMAGAAVTYAWTADGDPIAGAIDPTLELTPDLYDRAITVTTTATLADHQTQVLTSDPTAVVAAGTQTGTKPTVTGDAGVGNTLTATHHAMAGAAVTYAWTADGDPIPGATGDTLALTADLYGASITVTTTATLTGYAPQTLSSAPVTVGAGTQTGTGPTLTGNAVVGEELTAMHHAMAGADVTYAWAADGNPIPGAGGRTLALTPDLVGRRITVTTTATLTGYTPQTLTSAPVTVTAGTQAGTEPVITGDVVVGEELTATHHAMAGADVTYAWAADGDPIPGATGDTLALTADLYGASITVTTTATLRGYVTQTLTSAPVTVTAGTQTGTRPTVAGTPVVGGTLTAVAHAMAGAAVTYAWAADGHAIRGGTTATLALTPDLVGRRITVTTTATLRGYAPQTLTSDAIASVEQASFVGATVSVSGTTRVGDTLTATAAATPAPSDVTYRWERDGTVVGTGPTYRLTKADAGGRVTVTATLTRAGYADATARTTSAVVAVGAAPAITLTGSAHLRLGKDARLTWATTDADAVTGSWTTSPLGAAGSTSVIPTRTGTVTYAVTATNTAGTTTATHTVTVGLPATTLKVTARKKIASGKAFTVRVTGLGAGERFTTRLGTTSVRGTATSRGTAKVTLVAPTKYRAKTVTVKVVGSLPDRVGRARTRITARPLTLGRASRSVRASDPQTVTVDGLAKHEKVTVRVDGKVVHRGRGTRRGTFTHTFTASRVWGTQKVRVTAERTRRTARTTFTVGRRCADGVRSCH